MTRLDRNVYAVFLSAAVLAVLPGVARGQSGVQYSRDSRRVYVSKDVGGERWSITREPGTGIVSGLVFFPEGGAPLFVECDQRSDDGQTIGFACYGADRCEAAQCSPDAWSFISDVDLPAAFFASSGPLPTPEPGSNCTPTPWTVEPGPLERFAATGGTARVDGEEISGGQGGCSVLLLRSGLSGQPLSALLECGRTDSPRLNVRLGGTAFEETPSGGIRVEGAIGGSAVFGDGAASIRSESWHFEIDRACPVGEAITGRFFGRFQMPDGSYRERSGDFRSFRTS